MEGADRERVIKQCQFGPFGNSKWWATPSVRTSGSLSAPIPCCITAKRSRQRYSSPVFVCSDRRKVGEEGEAAIQCISPRQNYRQWHLCVLFYQFGRRTAPSNRRYSESFVVHRSFPIMNALAKPPPKWAKRCQEQVRCAVVVSVRCQTMRNIGHRQQKDGRQRAQTGQLVIIDRTLVARASNCALTLH